MKSLIRILSKWALWAFLFVLACLAECGIRAIFREEIPVVRSSESDVVLSAYHQPDFLWMGTAWWISYETDLPFSIDLGDGNSVVLPAGKHSIFSNHDFSNTRDYGIKFKGDYPDTIAID